MRKLRRAILVAIVGSATFLSCTPPAITAPPRPCSAPCAAYVEGVLRSYAEAVTRTLERQWYASVILGTPHSRCVIGHESANVKPSPWVADDGSGNYGGYQFAPGTFDSEAARAGRRDLVGRLPLEPWVAWWDQVQVYAQTYADQGDRPWGNRC